MHLRRFRLAAVVKVSVAFYGIAAVAFALLAAAVYLIGGNFGFAAGVDRLAVRLFGARPGFHLGVVAFVAGAAVAAAAVGLIGVVFNTVAAMLYNRIGELTGGVGVTLSPVSAADGEPGRPRPWTVPAEAAQDGSAGQDGGVVGPGDRVLGQGAPR